MNPARLFLVLSIFFCFVSPSQAAKEAHTEVDLLSEASTVAPGESFWVAVRMRMDEHWHVYWENAGDSGLPPELQWMLPAGWTAGSIQWPTPALIRLPPLASYGYEGEVLFLVEIHPPDQIPEQRIELKANVSWLACQVDCIPGKRQVTLPVAVAQISQKDPLSAQSFAEARARLPKTSVPWKIGADAKAKSWRMRFTGPVPSKAWFFAKDNDVILHAGDQILAPSPDGFTLEIPKSNLLSRVPASLPGIFEADGIGYQIDVPLGGRLVTGQLSLVVACLFALIGGLILNVMPCVLPVLSLKIIGLSARHYSRRESLRHGLVFALGVILSFWVLAGILLLIKSAGTQIGWGFQFQSPWFVGFMAVVFFILALNLLGVFEIGLGLTSAGGIAYSAKGLWQDFLNGLLATVVATPCTAPFMGTAITYGLTQSPFASFLIFTCLGAGMALPMVTLSAFPAALKFLPKPGPWMTVLKRVMAVFMLLSALWLGWVLALQLNVLSGKNQWRDYSPQLMQELRANNKSYFLDFTAAWCLTCQVNDRLVLQNRKVVEKFKEKSIILVKADWTKHDPAITAALADYGRNSIPFYVYYSPRTDQEQSLGETITVPGLIELLDQSN